MKNILNLIAKHYVLLVAIVSGGGFFISLYFSNIMDLAPCVLCWYQRILFYPIFFISAASIAFKEKLSPKYILTLALPGLGIAIYHYSLQKLGLGEGGFVPCVAGIPCDAIDWEILGFITIPLLSAVGFLIVTILTVIKMKFSTQNT